LWNYSTEIEESTKINNYFLKCKQKLTSVKIQKYHSVGFDLILYLKREKKSSRIKLFEFFSYNCLWEYLEKNCRNNRIAFP